MKITYAKLKDANGALEKLISADLDIAVSLPLRRLAKAVKEEMGHYNAEFGKLLDKYATKDDNGVVKADERGNVQVKTETFPEFRELMDRLDGQKVEIPTAVLDFTKIEGIKFSAVDLYHLEPFIKEA